MRAKSCGLKAEAVGRAISICEIAWLRASRGPPGAPILLHSCPRVWGQFRVLVLAGAVVVLGSADVSAQIDPYTDVWNIPTPSLYGGVGLIDMRNARFMPDGYFWVDGGIKSPDDRVDINFQATPWLETTFRYAINYALPPPGQRALYDRSFDFKIRLFQESEYIPQVAVGLQDFIGTGVYGAEYLVASKRFGPVDATLGMGWGRLASRPAFTNPFCVLDSRFCYRPNDQSETGGTIVDDYFRGQNVGIFGGLEYNTPIPRLTLKAEYSSDAYSAESSYVPPGQPVKGHIFTNYAPFPVNFEAQYRFWSNVDVGLAWMYGRVPGVNVDILTNLTEPNWSARIDPQPPFVPRSPEAIEAVKVAAISKSATPSSPSAQGSKSDPGLDDALRPHFVDLTALPVVDLRPPDPAMAGVNVAQQSPPSGTPAKPAALASTADILARMTKAIKGQGLQVDGIAIRNDIVKVEIENTQYLRDTEAVSRTLRVLSATAPADINAFEITTAFAHMPQTTILVPRAQADALGQQTGSPAELWASSLLADAKPSTRDGPVLGYPRFLWSLFPSVREDFFDPNNPIYIGLGISGGSHLELLPGLTLDGQATYKLWSDFGDITRLSNSVLPHVRSDVAEYLQNGFTGIDNLSMSYYVKPAPEIYAHITAGYIEEMFGAYGGEVLYRPFGQRWALGADLYEAFQRNTDDLFGFGHYHYQVLTGHASLYVETPWHGVTAVVNVGRYLAGDYGGTLELYRRFDSGIEIGAWATITNVPFDRFGEGSFDKGIKIRIPAEWALPFGSPTTYDFDLRPIQRDGGQPLDNAETLYDLTQSSSYGDLQRQWPHVFQ